jgi:hypothetical protein
MRPKLMLSLLTIGLLIPTASSGAPPASTARFTPKVGAWGGYVAGRPKSWPYIAVLTRVRRVKHHLTMEWTGIGNSYVSFPPSVQCARSDGSQARVLVIRITKTKRIPASRVVRFRASGSEKDYEQGSHQPTHVDHFTVELEVRFVSAKKARAKITVTVDSCPARKTVWKLKAFKPRAADWATPENPGTPTRPPR